MNNREFAEKIYSLRSEKGISQKELGDLLGVSNKAVSKWENGEAMPKTATLLKIAEVFELNIGELMGAETKEAEKVPDSNGEINSLKAENARLRSQLVQSDKRKRLGTAAAVVACAVLIAVTGVFAFFTGSTDADNKHAAGVGVGGSTVEFAGRSFEPLTPLDSLFYSADTYYFNNQKEAKLTAPDGKKYAVLIGCNSDYDVIEVTQGSKNYYYIAKGCHIKLTKDTVTGVAFKYGKTIAKSGDISFGDYNAYELYFTEFENDREIINAFIDFYNTKQKAEDKRAVELFLGNKGCTVAVDIKNHEYADVDVGEFFRGGDGKVYFYDYSDTEAYDVGKEMAKYVKGD